MSALESAAIAFCREVAKLRNDGQEPEVEFFWDNGIAYPFESVKVPTLRVLAFGINMTADHEGVRK